MNTAPAKATNAPARAETLVWLDALKGIAILAVVFDHAYVIDDFLVWKHAYFAVSWFILLAGVSNTLAARRRGLRPLHDAPDLLRRRCLALLGPYLWVSVACYLVVQAAHATPAGVLRALLLADAQPQLYFVPLLLQLLIAFPLLYGAIYRAGLRGWLFVGLLLVVVGPWLSHQLMFPWTLGAHYLLGASFLYLFVLGMVVAPLLLAPLRRLGPLLALCVLLAVLGERTLLRSGGFMMTHPPSNVMVPYVVGLLGIAYALCRLGARTGPVRALAWLGHRSLDIFLYHYIFLLPLLRYRDRALAATLPLPHPQVAVVALAIPGAVGGALLAAALSRQLWRHVTRGARGLARADRRPALQLGKHAASRMRVLVR